MVCFFQVTAAFTRAAPSLSPKARGASQICFPAPSSTRVLAYSRQFLGESCSKVNRSQSISRSKQVYL